jgi:type II secretory pathway pseudopilin PulG
MRTARGFSLVETTVVIGVIVLLAGLTLSAGTAVIRHGEQRLTATVLTQLDTAVREWELQADRNVSWWQLGYDDVDVYDASDVHSNTPPVLIITEILDAIRHNDAVRQILAQIEPGLVYRYRDDTAPWLDEPREKNHVNDRFVGGMTVLDAWGTPVYATHPGRLWLLTPTLPGYSLERDPDGTIRTLNEQNYGVAPNRRIVFVSAGPDQLFGLAAKFPPGEMTAMTDARLDNLYSTPVTFHAYGN